MSHRHGNCAETQAGGAYSGPRKASLIFKGIAKLALPRTCLIDTTSLREPTADGFKMAGETNFDAKGYDQKMQD